MSQKLSQSRKNEQFKFLKASVSLRESSNISSLALKNLKKFIEVSKQVSFNDFSLLKPQASKSPRLVKPEFGVAIIPGYKKPMHEHAVHHQNNMNMKELRNSQTTEYINKMFDSSNKEKIHRKLFGNNTEQSVSSRRSVMDFSLFGEGKRKFEFDCDSSANKAIRGIGGFGVCTSKGRVKTTNEDRVNVICNIRSKTSNLNHMSYFSVFDGHGGSDVSHYLRENLHELIFQNKNCPSNMKQALEEAIAAAESKCLDSLRNKKFSSRAGSTCLVMMIQSNLVSKLNKTANCSSRMSATAEQC